MRTNKRPGCNSELSIHPVSKCLFCCKQGQGNLYFINRSVTCLTKEIFVPLYGALVRPHLEYAIPANCPYLIKDIYHLEIIQRAATRWVKGLRDFTYEDRLKELKFQSLENRRIRNDLVLPHKIIYNQNDLEASQLFKFSRRPGLRMSSLRFIQQTGRRRTVLHAELLSAGTVYHLQQHRYRISQLSKDCKILVFTLNFALQFSFAPIWSFWAMCPFRIIQYMHTQV